MNKELNENEVVVEEVAAPKKVKTTKSTKDSKGKKVEKSRIFEVLTKEYKYENLILGILAVTVAVLSVYLIDPKGLTFTGSFPALEGREKVIGWSLLIFSLAIIVSLLYPFFKPSFEETRKVTFPTKQQITKESTIVFVFIVIFALIFFGLGIFFKELLVNWLKVVK